MADTGQERTSNKNGYAQFEQRWLGQYDGFPQTYRVGFCRFLG